MKRALLLASAALLLGGAALALAEARPDPAAAHPNHVWALDYQLDQTADGRVLTFLRGPSTFFGPASPR